MPSGADGVFVATARLFPLEEVRETFDLLERAASEGDVAQARELLGRITPTIVGRTDGTPETGARAMNVAAR